MSEGWYAILSALSLGLACSGTEFTAAACADSTCAGDRSSGGSGGRNQAGTSSDASGAPSDDGGRAGSDTRGGGGASAGREQGGVGAGSSGGAHSGNAGTSGAASAERFPQTGVLDDFDREGPAVGADWLGAADAFSLQKQGLWCQSCGSALLWKEGFGSQQEVHATFRGFDADASEINLVLKAQESADCDLVEIMYQPSSSTIRIAYCIVGEGWTESDVRPLVVEVGDTLGARAYSDGQIAIFHNQELVTTYAVNEFPFDAGHIGVNGIASDGGLGWDDFGGGEFE